MISMRYTSWEVTLNRKLREEPRVYTLSTHGTHQSRLVEFSISCGFLNYERYASVIFILHYTTIFLTLFDTSITSMINPALNPTSPRDGVTINIRYSLSDPRPPLFPIKKKKSSDYSSRLLSFLDLEDDSFGDEFYCTTDVCSLQNEM